MTKRLGGVLAATLATLALAAAQASASTPAQVTPRAGTITGATPFTVDASRGDQTDPHVSGNLVSYTNEVSGNSNIRVYDVSSGSAVDVPSGGGLDFLSDVSGGTVAYTHLAADSSIWSFDAATGTTHELDAVAAANRREGRLGGGTIAWQDFGFTGDVTTPEIVAYDTETTTVTRLTDDLMLDKDPAVAPDGKTIVWTNCEPDGSACTIWEATRDASGWSEAALTSAADGTAGLPDTDGSVVVYSAVGASGDEDVYWQPVGGGPAHELALPGQQTNPNVSNGVVTFEQLDTTTQVPNYDVWAYDIATNTLYRLTNDPEDETLNDVSVSPAREVTVVWTKSELDDNVYGERFTLPPLPASLTLSPAGGSQAAGTKATVAATVEDAAGAPVPGIVVRFAAAGAVSASGSCTTATDGTCSFAYDGPAAGGAVQLSAYADTNEDAVRDGAEAAATATRSFDADATPPVLSGVPGDLTVDATSPAGAVVSWPAPTAVDAVSGSVDVACAPASGSTFAIGTTPVTCSATDAAGNTANAGFSVTVRGAAEQLASLIDETAAFLGGGPPDGLGRQLATAAAQLAANHPKTACTLLGAYAKVVALTPLRALTTAERAQLIADAERIRAVLGC